MMTSRGRAADKERSEKGGLALTTWSAANEERPAD